MLSESPSSRRAWIEILKKPFIQNNFLGVALLAEGVDRNYLQERPKPTAAVALLAEGVDRNTMNTSNTNSGGCRPPRGGRG